MSAGRCEEPVCPWLAGPRSPDPWSGEVWSHLRPGQLSLDAARTPAPTWTARGGCPVAVLGGCSGAPPRRALSQHSRAPLSPPFPLSPLYWVE